MSLPPRPDRSSNPLVAWITRHKVCSVVIGLVGLLIIVCAISPDDQTDAATTTPLRPVVTSSPTAASSPSVPSPSLSTPVMIRVPAVVGVRIDSARQKLLQAGLELTDTKKKYSHQPPGTVL